LGLGLFVLGLVGLGSRSLGLVPLVSCLLSLDLLLPFVTLASLFPSTLHSYWHLAFNFWLSAVSTWPSFAFVSWLLNLVRYARYLVLGGVGSFGVGSWGPAMNGKHASGCNCAECLEYLERESSLDLDSWMPNHEDMSGMLRSALSTDDARPHVTHGHLPFEDAQLHRSHQGPDLSLWINNRTPLQTEGGNGVSRVADCAPLSNDSMEERNLAQTLTHTITVNSASSSSILMPNTYVGRRIHKKIYDKWVEGN
jgi:hypothetical protein